MTSKYKTGVVRRLQDKNIITQGSIPPFVAGNIQYETIMGSVAYGVSSDTSDCDIYGFCIPPKDMVFPHLAGEIKGFGTPHKPFDQYQQHHLKENDKVYDITIYSIVRYFHLCMGCNPNMIDSLFTPSNMVLTATRVANMVRDNRKLFLSKKAWHTFKGYAYAQKNKMNVKSPDQNSKRYEMVQKHGYDLKFAYHIIRLMDEVEQILELGDIDLQRNKEQLKSIRRGDLTKQEIEDLFTNKEKSLEVLYHTSKLPNKPLEAEIKNLLLNCLEEHYGNLNGAIVRENRGDKAVNEIREILRRNYGF